MWQSVLYLYYHLMEGKKMQNQYLVSWQWDDEGDAGLVKVMSFDTYEEAHGYLVKQKAGTLRDRTADGFPQTDEAEHWVSPHFAGTVARSLSALQR